MGPAAVAVTGQEAGTGMLLAYSSAVTVTVTFSIVGTGSSASRA